MRWHIPLSLWCHLHHARECILTVNIAGSIIHHCCNWNVSEFERNQYSVSFSREEQLFCLCIRNDQLVYHWKWSFESDMKTLFSMCGIWYITVSFPYIYQINASTLSACSDACSSSCQNQTSAIFGLLINIITLRLQLWPKWVYNFVIQLCKNTQNWHGLAPWPRRGMGYLVNSRSRIFFIPHSSRIKSKFLAYVSNLTETSLHVWVRFLLTQFN